jgi:hypothetical protein
VLSDLLGVDTVFLKRLYVLLYLELAMRRVIWFAVTDRPLACLGAHRVVRLRLLRSQQQMGRSLEATQSG